MTRYPTLVLAAALFALVSASSAALAQTGGHGSTLSTGRSLQLQKAAKPAQKSQPTAKATKPAPQSLRWLEAETP
ncbi:hypothetical protein VSR34_13520 [Paraburkholderia sp. JHI2823]|uniref:hypothetical protein n=1 Tax=Paraburkholderia TaxID=1822464 RepID=UPI0003FD1599|nr:hypothetical protein [Paraburkholderia mimosarum]